MSFSQELQPALASAIFLRIVDFTRQSVTEQTRQRLQLDAAIATIAAVLPAHGRVVLEAAEGAAILVLNDAAAALDAAARVLDVAAGVPLCVGLNHGPVKRDQRDTHAATVVGDGVEAAASAAAFAQAGGPDALLLTRAFRDALLRQVPRRAAALVPAGEFTDAGMRSHELFRYDPAAARRRGLRRTVLGVTGIAVVLGLGVAGRYQRLAWEEARRPATLTFAIKPLGEIYLDGEFKGTSPPLSRLSLPPGAHSVEIRNGRFKPVTVDLNLEPGEEMQIKHTFIALPVPQRKPAPQPAAPSPFEKFKFWK